MAPDGSDKNDFERERDARIAANKAKIMELGLEEAGSSMADAQAKKPKKARAKKPKLDPELMEARKSERPRKEVNYAEVERGPVVPGASREPIDYTERIQAMTLDAETAEAKRLEMEAKRADSKANGKSRGPVDSGKGVRVQGGRVYDSKHGVTCHWCRQKTLEDHVTCTNPNCGHGRRMPLSFCSRCLKNRHGEDFEAAERSGEWWCPACRGSCGPGCVICCNCGPCRKRAGLDPTHQVAKLARDAGFDNVHDYLVHLVTGETPEVIAARKLTHRWGSWLKPGGGSEGSEQTAGAAGSCEGDEPEGEACEGDAEMDEPPPAAVERQPTPGDVVASGDQGTAQKGKRGSRARGGKAGGAVTAQPEAAPAKAKASGGKRKSGGRSGSSKAAEAAQPELEAAAQPEAAAASEDEDEDDCLLPPGEDEEAPMLSSQDMQLSRKERMKQKLGLAPVTVCA